MHRGHLAARHAQEARQPSLGGEQVVAAFVERAVGHAIADGEELAASVEEEREVHPVGEGEHGGRRVLAPARLRARGERGALERLLDLEQASAVQAGSLGPGRLEELADLARGRAGGGGQLVQRQRGSEQAGHRGQPRDDVLRQRREGLVEHLRPRGERIQVAPMAGDGRLQRLD